MLLACRRARIESTLAEQRLTDSWDFDEPDQQEGG
jgi:hypothetical protein